MSLNSNPSETDESAEKLRALSKLFGAEGASGGADADETSEILYSLMESLDPDALAFLEANPALCQAEYGEEKIAAIIQKTRKAAGEISER